MLERKTLLRSENYRQLTQSAVTGEAKRNTESHMRCPHQRVTHSVGSATERLKERKRAATMIVWMETAHAVPLEKRHFVL